MKSIPESRPAIVAHFAAHFQRGMRENINIIDARGKDLPPLSPREVLEAIVIAINSEGGIEIVDPPVAEEDDDVLAGIAYALVYEAARAVQAARRVLGSVESGEQMVKSLESELKAKTEALRQLQKERDPDRVETLVKERVAIMVSDRELVIASQRADNEALRREISELRESKRRLKEANERLKDNR